MILSIFYSNLSPTLICHQLCNVKNHALFGVKVLRQKPDGVALLITTLHRLVSPLFTKKGEKKKKKKYIYIYIY